ncbi:hypothetical protein JCM10207_008744 [Rhodosporidiobolus poonsookiae]
MARPNGEVEAYSPSNPQLSPGSAAALVSHQRPLPPHLSSHPLSSYSSSPASSAIAATAALANSGALPSPSTSGSAGTTPVATGAVVGSGPAQAMPPVGTAKGNGRPDMKGKRKASEADDVNGAGAGGDAVKAAKEKKKVKVGARASIACKTCRKRKVRCSAEWPVCSFCQGRKLECVYEGHPAENGGSLLAGPSGIIPNGGLSALEADLPEPAIILEALDVFFIHYYDTFPFLHRPTLTEEINQQTAPKELVCCLLALAARFCQPLKDLHPTSPAAAPELYARMAAELLTLPETASGYPALPSSADTPISLIRCQCFLILGFYEVTAGRDNSGWLKVGNSIRMAQVLRLGFEDEVPVRGYERDPLRDESDPKNPQHRKPDPLRAEIRRRTWWALFFADRTISDGNERPCGLKVPRIASLRMPGPDADFLAGRQSLGAKFDPDPPAWSVSTRAAPTSAEPEADLYGHTLRIAEIWSLVAGYIGSGGRNVDRRAPWQEDSTFAELAKLLGEFEARLPDVFKYSQQTMLAHCMGPPMDARMYGMLHLLNAGARHVLHRDYLPFLPPLDFKAANGPVDGEPLFGDESAPEGWWQRSFDIAAESANTISDVCTLLNQHGIVLSHPFSGFASVAAGTVHTHLRFWPQSSSVPIDAAHYCNQDIEILNGLRKIYPIAERWYENLAGLAILYYNLAQGILDADPLKVRAGLLQLMRSAKDEADVDAARKPMPPNRNGAAARHPAVVAASAGAAALPATTPPLAEEPPRIRTLSQALGALVPSPMGPSTPTSGVPPGPPGGAFGDVLPPPLPTDLLPLGAGGMPELPSDFAFDLASLHSGGGLGGLGGLGLGLSTLDEWGSGYWGGGNGWGLAGFGGLGTAFPPPGVPPNEAGMYGQGGMNWTL